MFAFTTLTNQFNFPQQFQNITLSLQCLTRFVSISDKWAYVEYLILIPPSASADASAVKSEA